MTFRLLTGATGLLGGYLLRDLLLRDERIVVVVRPCRSQSPEERIDAVLAHWEEQWERTLPRPIVFSGDVTEPLLGLGVAERKWLRRHCQRVLHSAASLAFYAEGDEPWRTNVDGVRHVLGLCHDADVPVLEHISSAYVCGRRTGRVYEAELNVGQEFRNDYEKSKADGEALIHADKRLQGFTIFRPAIIVGDSRTGFTPTFHGFYSPLRVATALLSSVTVDEALEVDYLGLLGLSGNERKNYVPVDWVSDAIISILSRTVPQRRTFTLAPRHAVSTARLQAVLGRAVRRRMDRSGDARAARCDWSARAEPGGAKAHSWGTDFFQKAFVERLSLYRSYWGDDPDFDVANTQEVVPDLPCPEMTDEILDVLIQYSLNVNFGFPPSRYDPPSFSPREWIRRRGRAFAGNGTATVPSGPGSTPYGITVTGRGGGSWTISDEGGDPFSFLEGQEDLASVYRMTSNTFRELVCGDTSIEEAVAHARVVVYGPGDLGRLRRFLQAKAEAPAIFGR